MGNHCTFFCDEEMGPTAAEYLGPTVLDRYVLQLHLLVKTVGLSMLGGVMKLFAATWLLGLIRRSLKLNDQSMIKRLYD